MALVLCSGQSWSSSDSSMPMPRSTQQLQQRRLVGEVRAGRVAEAVARAAIALLEQLAHVARIVVAEAELGADLAVDVLGQRLGQLDPQPVQADIVLVAVGSEPVARDLGGALADGDHLQAQHVALGLVDIAQEVGDAQAALLGLARQGEAGDLAAAGLVEQDDRVPLARGLEVAIGRLRGEDLLLARPRRPARSAPAAAPCVPSPGTRPAGGPASRSPSGIGRASAR